MDRTTPLETEQEPMFAALPEPAWLAVIEGAGHFTFSDVCILVDLYGEEALEQLGASVLTDGCGDENIDVDTAHGIINTLTTALFQAELQDHAEALGYLVSGPHVEVRP
jgi:predicted dienelactone hydrolase